MHSNTLTSLRAIRLVGCFVVILLLIWLPPFLTGCRHYKYDTPQIRQMQANSLKAVGQRNIAGQSLSTFFQSRVRLLICFKKNEPPLFEPQAGQPINLGGRASAISPDGYFITAHHVLSDGIPYLAMPPEKVSNASKINEIRWLPGRVVTTFEPADIALLKFDLQMDHWFNLTTKEFKKGRHVFTGANDGIVFGKDKVGNGPFLVFGKIIKVSPLQDHADYHKISSDMVSRGGMSGAPLVDTEGDMLGVLVEGTYRQVIRTFLSSEFHSIPAAIIENTISVDRKKQEMEQHFHP